MSGSRTAAMKAWTEPPTMSEADLQRLVTDALSALGWDWVHVRAGMTRHGWRVPVSGPLGQGLPDVFAVRARDARALWIECKADRGRVTPDQARVHDVLRAAGFDVRVVRPSDVDALLEALR